MLTNPGVLQSTEAFTADDIIKGISQALDWRGWRAWGHLSNYA